MKSVADKIGTTSGTVTINYMDLDPYLMQPFPFIVFTMLVRTKLNVDCYYYKYYHFVIITFTKTDIILKRYDHYSNLLNSLKISYKQNSLKKKKKTIITVT